MNYHTHAMPVCLLACLGLCQSLTAGEDEHRHHDSHEHGVAEMNLAVDGPSILIELHSPAVNIVGFEHMPRDEAERKQVKQAVKRLQAADSLFIFTADANCQLNKAEIETELDQGHDDHDHHGHAHDEPEETHSEFSASYLFSCGAIGMLKRVDVKLFTEFEGLEEIKVQVIMPDNQGLTHLGPARSTIIFE